MITSVVFFVAVLLLLADNGRLRRRLGRVRGERDRSQAGVAAIYGRRPKPPGSV